MDSGNSKRLNSKQFLISKHFWCRHRLFYNINYMLITPLISKQNWWQNQVYYYQGPLYFPFLSINDFFFTSLKLNPRHKHAKRPPSDLTPWTLTLVIMYANNLHSLRKSVVCFWLFKSIFDGNQTLLLNQISTSHNSASNWNFRAVMQLVENIKYVVEDSRL